MGIVAGIWLLLLGVLGASNLIISKRPDAEKAIEVIQPYQGWGGAVSALWGVWIVISAILNIGWIGKGLLLWWITFLASGLLLLSLGLLLGANVLKTFITQEEAVLRMNQTIKKLAPYQANLGIVAIVVGLWAIIARLTFLG